MICMCGTLLCQSIHVTWTQMLGQWLLLAIAELSVAELVTKMLAGKMWQKGPKGSCSLTCLLHHLFWGGGRGEIPILNCQGSSFGQQLYLYSICGLTRNICMVNVEKRIQSDLAGLFLGFYFYASFHHIEGDNYLCQVFASSYVLFWSIMLRINVCVFRLQPRKPTPCMVWFFYY